MTEPCDKRFLPKIDFDHNTTSFANDPWNKYSELHSKCPVAYTEAHGGFWVASKYEDVCKIARDDKRFSSVPTVIIPDNGVYNLIPLQSDPPDLQKYRAALLPFFRAKKIASMACIIRKFTNECIDKFVGRGNCDLVTELANPVPSMTALHFIGLNPKDWHDFAGPLHKMSYAADGSEERNKALKDLENLDQVITDTIQNRKDTPKNDVITSLVNYQNNGIYFTRTELHGLIKMLIFAGLDTTMAALSNAFLYLSQHPDQRKKLIMNSNLIPGAIEELLRYEAPVHAFARNVLEDTEVGGHNIKKGEKVYMCWAAANRDPDKFINPNDVIFERKPNNHLTFGVGSHHCLGASLARLEMEIILQEVLKRIPDFKIDLDLVKHPRTVTIIWGRTALPATFSVPNKD